MDKYRQTLDLATARLKDELAAYLKKIHEPTFDSPPYVRGLYQGYTDGLHRAVRTLLIMREESWRKDAVALAEEALK